MFSGVMIDVAIGMLLIFLVSSLIASAVVESVGGFLHRRSKNLWDTIDLMLGRATFEQLGEDNPAERVVDLLYQDSLISSVVRPTTQPFFAPDSSGVQTPKVLRQLAKNPPWRGSIGPGRMLKRDEIRRRFYGPQSIVKTDFADSLLRVLRSREGFDEATDDLDDWITKLPKGLQDHLKRITGKTGSSLDEMRSGIEEWYENHMTAVSIWYRKQTRWFLFAAGLMMAASLNVDAVSAATTLYRDADVRTALVERADGIANTECTASDEAEKVDCIRDRLDGSVELPIGWGDRTDTTLGAWILRLVGWVAIAGSVTVGAPFWFDLLRRVLEFRRKASS